MRIRELQSSDQEAFFRMQTQLDRETKFMMYEPGERPVGDEAFKGLMSHIEQSGSCILVAEEDEKLVGIMGIECNKLTRIRHVAYIAVGILKEYRHRGIGTKLFEEAEKWARERNITRLELTVMCHNENAIALYKKAGFKEEGRKVHAMVVDGEYVDEYYMAKLL